MLALPVKFLAGGLVAGWARTSGSSPGLEDSIGDAELMRQAAQGNAAAFERIYDRHAGAVFALLLRMTRDRGRAEDLTQEAFLALWRHAADFDAAALSALPWLLVVARRRALDLLRSARARREQATEPARFDLLPRGGAEAAAEARWFEAEALGQIRAAFAGLAPEERRVLELAYFEGLTQAEVAARIEAPLGTVKTWTRSGLAKLREALA